MRTFHFRFSAIMISVAFLLSACTSSISPNIELIPNEEVELQESIYSDIDVYIDSTPSMAGFASNKATNYIETIDDISSISTTLSGTLGKVKYYSFGANIVEISQVEFIQTKTQSFYFDNKTDNRTTQIASVMKEISKKYNNSNDEKSKRLSFIITDLFEVNSNMDPLINNLKSSLAATDLSIGVLGVRCYFDGLIYDIGRNTSGTPYKSNEKDIKSYRPVYIIAIGSPGDVLNSMDMLMKLSLTDLPSHASYFELFTKDQVTRLASVVESDAVLIDSKDNARIKIDAEKQNDISTDNVIMLRFLGDSREKGNKTEKIITTYELFLVEGTRLATLLHGGSNVLADKQDELFLNEYSMMRMDENGDFSQDIQPGILGVNTTIQSNQLVNEITLDPYSLEEGVYEIHIETTVNPDIMTPVIPADWNMKDENDPGFGTKTINLYNILESLNTLYFSSNKPIIKTNYYLKVMD